MSFQLQMDIPVYNSSSGLYTIPAPATGLSANLNIQIHCKLMTTFQNKLPPCMARNTLGLEFSSAAQLSKRPGSVWNCLWGYALKRSPGIIRKSRVSYPGPGFLSSATWPSLPKKHYNGLNKTFQNRYIFKTFLSQLIKHIWRGYLEDNPLLKGQISCGKGTASHNIKRHVYEKNTGVKV